MGTPRSRSAAHPRVGGENVVDHWAGVIRRGSSPRGRGKQALDLPCAARSRLIPAWAGKTAGACRTWLPLGAHPRVGGENGLLLRGVDKATGSSPRGRGKRLCERLREEMARLIPAWAGKTPTGRQSTGGPGAHPRVGGENDARRVALAFVPGSSPRGRGKPAGPSRPASKPGLIPAWAGKTQRYVLGADEDAAHPRVGGENSSAEI